MTSPKRSRRRFAALEDFCLGYLHQDFVAVHGTPERAMDAFVAEAGTGDLARLARDWRAFDASQQSKPLAARVAALERLGCAWVPTHWVDVQALFARLDVGLDEPD